MKDEISVVMAEPYNPSEQDELLGIFTRMLGDVTRDGGRKRKKGTKVSWKIDCTHEAAIFSHLNAWKHGIKKDADSGAHPLVHLAWRALAIAWKETQADLAPQRTPQIDGHRGWRASDGMKYTSKQDSSPSDTESNKYDC